MYYSGNFLYGLRKPIKFISCVAGLRAKMLKTEAAETEAGVPSVVLRIRVFVMAFVK